MAPAAFGESVQDLELAARARLDDALTLRDRNRLIGAVYLLGYVAEMYLKVAVYRRLGARPNAQTRPLWRRARNEAERMELPRHLGQWDGGHGLMFWARLLWSLPSAEGTLDGRVRADLFRHVSRIERHWTIHLRYSPNQGGWQEAQIVYASVEWIRRRRFQLWR